MAVSISPKKLKCIAMMEAQYNEVSIVQMTANRTDVDSV